jgi:hypothetical protein
MTASLDSQQVEILGRAALTAALVADDLEVAIPERDEGIDLIVFTVEPWRVRPVQMKASTGAVFSVDKKYERVEGLVMTYVWNARPGGEPEFYAMPWARAVEIAHMLGWTQTASWTTKGRYATSRPPARVREALATHRVEPGGWKRLLEPGE